MGEFLRIQNKKLVRLLQLAHAAERAAAFAYIGHAGSLRDKNEKQAVRKIEQEEWEHRSHVKAILLEYNIPCSRYFEVKYYLIGKFIGWSCYIIGRFMPYFFAGRLESGNVCEYFTLMRYFHSMGVTKHDKVLFAMGITEKEHEVYFLNCIKDKAWLPYFEKVFRWGVKESFNDVDLESLYSVEESDQYCVKK